MRFPTASLGQWNEKSESGVKMILFHGSPVGKIKKLIPNISNHNSPYVYFSSNRSVALFYTVRKNWYPYGFVGSEKSLQYTECYPDGLKDIYQGRRGYIYECSGEGLFENPTNIFCAFVSRHEIAPQKEETIEDVYEEILKLEAVGEIKVKRFFELSEKEKSSNSKMILEEIIKGELVFKKSDYSEFIRTKFPKEWEIAKNSK